MKNQIGKRKREESPYNKINGQKSMGRKKFFLFLPFTPSLFSRLFFNNETFFPLLLNLDNATKRRYLQKEEGRQLRRQRRNQRSFFEVLSGSRTSTAVSLFLDTQDIRGKTGGWSIGTQVTGLLENLFFFRVLRSSPSEKRNSFHTFFLFGRGDFRSGFYCCLLRANTG